MRTLRSTLQPGARRPRPTLDLENKPPPVLDLGVDSSLLLETSMKERDERREKRKSEWKREELQVYADFEHPSFLLSFCSVKRQECRLPLLSPPPPLCVVFLAWPSVFFLVQSAARPLSFVVPPCLPQPSLRLLLPSASEWARK